MSGTEVRPRQRDAHHRRWRSSSFCAAIELRQTIGAIASASVQAGNKRRGAVARLAAGWIVLWLFGPACGFAQGIAAAGDQPELPEDWLVAEPFDLIYLNQANRKLVLQVLPLEIPRGRPPQLPRRDGSIRVRMIDDPESWYDLDWVAVDRIELFETMLLNRARQLTREEDWFAAFQHYGRLFSDYPQTDGLEESYSDYLFADALRLFRQERFDEALIPLQQLWERQQDQEEIQVAVSRVVERTLNETFFAGDYDALRGQLRQFAARFGPAVAATVTGWEGKLQQSARQKIAAARRLTGANQGAERRVLCQQALAAWPDVPGAVAMLQQTYLENALVRVGVRAPARKADPQRITGWSSQRLASLTNRGLVQLVGFGDNGLVTRSPLLSWRPGADMRSVTCQLNSSDIDSYQLFRQLHPSTTWDDQARNPLLARFLHQLHPAAPDRLEITWQVPLADPQPLLNQAVGANLTNLPASLRPYRVGEAEAASSTEMASDSPRSYRASESLTGGPRQILEEPLGPLDQWQKRWRRGELDVIDRLWPAETVVARQLPSAALFRYRFPSQHWLVVNRRGNQLELPEFRRALVYSIDRRRWLDEFFVGGQDAAGCRVIDGPCPRGFGRDDPLAYGAPSDVEPRPYDPALAKLLLGMSAAALNRLADPTVPNSSAAADVDATAQPAAAATPLRVSDLPPLVLVHPQDDTIARVCEKIAQGWELLGLKVRLRRVSSTEDLRQLGTDWDLAYLDLRVREPLTDIQRLFGPQGLVPTPGSYVRTAEQQLVGLTEWGELREVLQQLHRAAHNDVAIIPLWQVADYGLRRSELMMPDSDRAALYDNVESWTWQLGVESGGGR